MFTPSRSHSRALELPCGQCIGCRVEKSRQWATRCIHEAALHDDNCFITLTYDDANIPWDGSLNKKHFQDFMKRTRKKYQHKIRYFHCGEYGEKLQRPHYHALLFGHDWTDKELWTENEGCTTWTSEQLNKLWPWGFTTSAEVTWESAAYCARYVTKKQTGKNETHYWRQLATDLEIELQPEYATMSLKPAIGKEGFDTYKDDCFPSDYITVRGKKHRIPKYYDSLHDEIELLKVKKQRRLNADKWRHETTPQRLKAREECAQVRLAQQKRNLEG